MKFKIKQILAVMVVFCMMMGMMPVQAFAEVQTYVLSVSAEPAEGGTVYIDTPGVTEVPCDGSGHRLIAEANDGYEFVGWYENGNFETNHYINMAYTSAQATRDYPHVAIFKKTIKNIEITMPDKAGDTLSRTTVTVPDGKGYQIQSFDKLYVYENADSETYTYIGGDTQCVLAEGNVVRGNILMANPLSGYAFDSISKLTATVNGKSATVGDMYSKPYITFEYTVSALAPTPTLYDVWVAGTQVTSANAADILGGGEASYDADTNTLTVSGNISATGDDHAIYAETTETLTVEIADDVKIDTSNSNGIYTINDLAIICGDLTITAAKKGIASWYGSVSISGSENSEITIKSGDHAINAYLNVNIDCDTLTLSSSNGRGIYCEDGGGNDGYVDISGGDIAIDAAARDGIKKENGDITIDCDSLEVTANTNGTNGIYCDGSLSITADKANVNSHGIALCGNEAVNILCDNLSVISTGSYGIGSSNGAITLSGNDKSKISVEFYDYGIKTKNKIDIKCAELDVVSVSEYSNGIYSEENEVTITCSDIDVQANNNGIYGHDDVTIDCDTATIVGGTYGISTSGSIIITDGEFDIQSTDVSASESEYCAISFGGDFTYPEDVTVIAATEPNGTFEAYDLSKNKTYDHVKIGVVEEVTPITTVEIDGVSAPQLNQTREAFWNKYNTELTDGTITLNEKTYVDGKFDNIMVVDGEFYHADKETVVDDSHVIAPGTYYNALALLPAEGFEFAEDITATVDGATATETEFLENGVLVIYAKYVLEAPAPVQPTEYTITIEGGKASVGAGTPVDKATAGTVITLTVDESAIPAGKVFDKWEVVSGGVTVADGKFTMPANAVEIRATYKDAPVIPTEIDEIKIEGLPAPQYGQTVEQYWNAYLQNESNGVLTINGEKLSEDYFGNLYFAGNDLFDGNMDPYDDTDATFTPGTYYFYLCLRPANGYTFADSLNVSVKDVESANVDVDFNDENDLTKPVYIYVEYEVTAPAVAPTEIDEIKIEGLPAPQYGQTYSQWNDTFNNNCDTGVLKINESIGVDGWNFGDVFLDGKSLMDETMKHFYETITAGTYYVKLWLYHSEGFVFADGLSITVDGVNPANVTFEQDPDEEECKIVYVKYEITAPSSAPTEITEVDATVAEPVVGGTPSTVATTTGTDYTVFVSGWYDEEENTVSVFEAGKTYTLEVGFTPKEGYVLAGSKTLNATINDKEAEYLSLNTINGTVTCFIRYTIPAVVPTEYNITVNGGTASVGAGTAVTKATAGTVITLTIDESAIPAGKVFDKWEVVSGGVTVADGKFTMPESAVEINATYKDAPVDPPFVDWIEISDVTAPVAGTDASIAPNYVVDSARNYTVEKAEWWMNDIDSKATEFVAGTNYRAVFTLVPKEGVVFDSPLKVKINGNDATVISSSEDKAVVSISLTATSAPVSHTCDIKPVAKDEPSCTEGGKEAYYKCEGCGKFYEDALGAKEITDLANWGNLPKLGHTESDWKSDKDNHWKECTVTACGVIIENSKAAHKDDNKDGKCDVCEDNVGLPTTPDEDKPNDNPQTDDNSNMFLWIALLFVSGLSVVATVFGKKKFSVK